MDDRHCLCCAVDSELTPILPPIRGHGVAYAHSLWAYSQLPLIYLPPNLTFATLLQRSPYASGHCASFFFLYLCISTASGFSCEQLERRGRKNCSL